MIEGVLIEPLKVFSDSRGKVMHMLRSDSLYFRNFGEIYFSTINPGAIKGWKKHLKMTQNFAVPSGNVKVVIYDDRKGCSTGGEVQEVVIGQDNYCLLQIPPQVWYSFRAVGGSSAMVANCTDMPHDLNETASKDIFDKSIPYVWRKEE
ncbi:MAG: dTDP-4-dehydrorhamnose 3,5-epimerase family protein [Candidatus Omnitrophica bacterium]|nr:dTDP-4-dehydrorhamnose 3,5-epimerase family protein [Candidatus Omnitrophota bacterium]